MTSQDMFNASIALFAPHIQAFGISNKGLALVKVQMWIPKLIAISLKKESVLVSALCHVWQEHVPQQRLQKQPVQQLQAGCVLLHALQWLIHSDHDCKIGDYWGLDAQDKVPITWQASHCLRIGPKMSVTLPAVLSQAW